MNKFILIICLVFYASTGVGYTFDTHKELTQIVNERSELGFGVVFQKVGILVVRFENDAKCCFSSDLHERES